MDAFRCVELPDPYIYVIDPVDGHTKAVVDKFFSFLWVERRSEAGELEITAPEDTFWSKVIQEGDYIHFKASSASDYFREMARPSNCGRYTMVVEAKYTEYDADNGYTTYVKGHSLDILLNRRINLGIVENNPTPATEVGDGSRDPNTHALLGTNDYRARQRDGYLFGLAGTTNEYVTPAEQEEKTQEDNGWNYYGLYMVTLLDGKNYQFNDPTIPYIIENLISDSPKAPNRAYEAGITAGKILTDIVRFNCGDKCLNTNRIFPNFEVRTDNLASLNLDTMHEKSIDGRFENVYDLITDLLPQIGTYTIQSATRVEEEDPETHEKHMVDHVQSSQTYLSMRMVGWTEGVRGTKYSTVFKMGFELYQGRDLTITGPYKDSAPVIYSRDMDNLISMNYLTGEANYKNIIYYDTGHDYTPDDIWKKNKEIEALEKEKDLLDIEDQKEKEKKTKELDDKIDKLNKEVDKLKEEYENRGLRIPYISVIDRTQMDKFFNGTAQVGNYPSGLARREMYVDDDLPFVGASAPEDDNEEVDWQGRPFLKYRYTIRHEADSNVENSKPTYEDKFLAVDWNYNTQYSINPIAKTTFKDPDNSKEDDVEAELNYNAVYQPKRNYDIGDLVTVMGLHHNEITRTAQIDEMAYSIDSSGYTIVPTFTILPIEDDAV